MSVGAIADVPAAEALEIRRLGIVRIGMKLLVASTYAGLKRPGVLKKSGKPRTLPNPLGDPRCLVIW